MISVRVPPPAAPSPNDPRPAAPWPAPPAPQASAVQRMEWYAAVARMAPSKHNAQPWRFGVAGGALEVWPDPTRWLPEADPQQRELVLSCGAAAHLAAVAARALGHRPVVELLPDGPDGALVRLTECGPWAASERDRQLLDAVARRRTDRGPLDGDALPVGLPFDLQSEAELCGASLRLVTSPGDRVTLTQLVLQADHQIVHGTHADEELGRWLRPQGSPEGDGIPVGPDATVEAFHRVPAAAPHREAQLPVEGQPHPDAPLLAVLYTATDDVHAWLRAGRALAAVLLQVARAGGNASYLNQPVEVPAMRVLLREQLTLPGVAQLVLRIGVGSPVPATPRRDRADLVQVHPDPPVPPYPNEPTRRTP